MAIEAATRAKAAGVLVEDVNLSYGPTHVLKSINLEVRPGEFFAFLGPSGCGKTTLLRLIAGFNIAQSGRVKIAGEDISALPPWKRDVGMVFQSYALWPHMTVAKNVAFGLEERKLPKAEIERRVKAALDLVSLGHLADRRPSQLSGGQQQRVAVARTVVIEPKVLLLDEPLSNLDAKMRVQVRRELRDLQQRLGLTTIFVTHDQEEANTICDRVAVMNDGIVQQVGTPMELYEKPKNLFVAGFLGAANILDGEVVSSGAERVFRLAENIVFPLPNDIEWMAGSKLVFRPQHCRFDLNNANGTTFGRIAHREFLGAVVRYSVSVGSHEIMVETPFESGDGLVEPGAKVGLRVSPDRLRILAS
ncbi:MAG: ABC transporter ATP-binding protein [Beijerinckiaceae bacterium]|jgi:iron(III) transport system ATP-binding protein|nr:ABC transporter ATP-binding protein [Beijerinckiaceae bacterium]